MRIEEVATESAVLHVPRDEQDLHVRAERGRAFGQLPTVHVGHDHVRKQEVDGCGVTLGDDKRLARVASIQHDVSVLAEHVPVELPDRLIILHQQDRLPPARHGLGPNRVVRVHLASGTRIVDPNP